MNAIDPSITLPPSSFLNRIRPTPPRESLPRRNLRRTIALEKLRLMAGLTAARRAAITVRWRNIVGLAIEVLEEVLESWLGLVVVVLFDDREAERS